MDDTTIDDLANLATATSTSTATSTAAYHDVVEILTEENARLARQLEERSEEVKEVKAVLNKEGAERVGRITFSPSLDKNCWYHGYKVARSHTSQSCTFPKDGHKREATKNQHGLVSGKQGMMCRGNIFQ
jgi:hypothetical protein